VTREAIVAAALEAIQHNGLRGLALRAVARRLDVSLPAVQHHFPTRDALWRACVDDAIAGTLAALRGDPPEVPGAVLADHLRRLLARATLTPGLTTTMWNDTEEGAAERLNYLEARSVELIAAARERIERARAAGVLREIDPDVLLALIAFGLSSLGTAGEGLRRTFGIDLADAAAREEFAGALADILLRGVLASPGGATADGPSTTGP
jgi:AcrR family transcriptional regulator